MRLREQRRDKYVELNPILFSFHFEHKKGSSVDRTRDSSLGHITHLHIDSVFEEYPFFCEIKMYSISALSVHYLRVDSTSMNMSKDLFRG